jgi:hypothetical protein
MYAPVLLLKHLTTWLHMQYGMPLLGAIICKEGRYFYLNTQIFDTYL